MISKPLLNCLLNIQMLYLSNLRNILDSPSYSNVFDDFVMKLRAGGVALYRTLKFLSETARCCQCEDGDQVLFSTKDQENQAEGNEISPSRHIEVSRLDICFQCAVFGRRDVEDKEARRSS